MFENRYSFVDRWLHRLAFATPRTQIEFAEIENERFEREFGSVEVQRPVFVTGLPRAGTTFLLDQCARLDHFASHTYRDMPFITTPLTWRRFSTRYRKQDEPRERAHGDGVMVSVDSAEGFDEVIWKTFWPEQYQSDRIVTWPALGGGAFEAFYRCHMAKLTVLGRDPRAGLPRYLSKNNLNIARLTWLKTAFQDATIIVPFRQPVEHASSLLAQHSRFLELHAKDGFMREYMAGIGHFDFGANLRPIDFDGWLNTPHPPVTTLAFWLEYWTAAYKFCLHHQQEGVVFFDFDQLCDLPEPSLSSLAGLLDIRRELLLEAVPSVRPLRPLGSHYSTLDEELLERANNIHAKLKSAAQDAAAEFAQ